jgi:hypothetical protein
MDKLIIVFYISIKGLPIEDVEQYITDVAHNFKAEKDEKYFFMPIRDGESRLECLNPKMVSEDDYKQAMNMLESNQKMFVNFLKDMNNE